MNPMQSPNTGVGGSAHGNRKETPCAHTCHRCIKEFGLTNELTGFSLASSKMILCPECGNKRCPHASDHRLACTGSNKPGQRGSVYE